MNWIEDFIDYLRFERNYSGRTTEDYQADLEAFKRFYEEIDSELTWAEMPPDIIRQWVVEMMDKGNVATSVRRRLSSLRSFYKFLLRRGLVTKDPVHNMPGPKVEKKLPAFVREKEMDRLFDGDFFSDDYQGFRDRMILLTFYSTGIRLSELVGLTEKDVDLDQMQLKVTGKRNKQRIIPYGDEFGDSLRQYLAERDAFAKMFASDDASSSRNICRWSPHSSATARMCYGTRSPQQCSTIRPTCNPSRNCSGTKVCQQQKSILTPLSNN